MSDYEFRAQERAIRRHMRHELRRRQEDTRELLAIVSVMAMGLVGCWAAAYMLAMGWL